ncbi:hypothetical protein LEP1GSC068_0853 [Leptospira sp. Fiocruz LV3954]|nr:hypothetical protein LEP1GSC068_0853 [Leptospira sp. Fiocruz LV3954]
MEELDAMLESGGAGLAVWHLMYIQDKPEKHTYENNAVSLFKNSNELMFSYFEGLRF